MNNGSIVLVVDDEKAHADVLAEGLEKVCAETIAAYDAKKAIEILKGRKIDVVVTDLNLGSDINGIDLLMQAKEANAASETILITAYATIETCKEALRCGAYDYLTKPIDVDQLRTIVSQACKKSASAPTPAKADEKKFKFTGISGQTAGVQSVFSVLRRVAPTDITVLIEGESGTGKELMAHAIHDNSKRSKNAFKPINCAGLTESLLESELFGHAKGAFTGAAEARKGLFETADNGTLFLDEIGDMPMAMQAKLLRVLEDGVVVPVGANKATVVDVRVISATNHNLARLVEEKKFRQDLYFRIKGVSVTIPPLRDRVEDIAEFVEFFINESRSDTGTDISGITPAAMNILKGFNWPGNVRQLRNSIRTMMVMCDKNTLDVQDIPADIYHVKQLAGGATAGATLNELEKHAIVETLAKTGNNREKAAKILGIGERTLYRKIKEYGL